MINTQHSLPASAPLNFEMNPKYIMAVLQRQLTVNRTEITPLDKEIVQKIAKVASRVFSDLNTSESSFFLNQFIDVCKKHLYQINHIPHLSDLQTIPKEQRDRILPLSINDSALRIKFTQFCAKQNGALTLQMLPWLPLDRNSETRKEELIEIAEICAQNDPENTARWINKFNLDPRIQKDKEALIKIAKFCALNKNGAIARHIQNFKFNPADPQDRNALIEIAKISAINSPGETAECIENFQLNPQYNKKDLIEIAKICASNDGGGTSASIRNFGIDPTDPEELKSLIDVAKICAQQNGGETAENIYEFHLDPKNPEEAEALCQIAELCVRQDPFWAAEAIEKFPLDEQIKKMLLLLAGECDPDCFILLKDSEEIKLLAEIASEERSLEDAEKNFNHWIGLHPEFKHILELVNQTVDPFARRYLLRDVGAILILLFKKCSQEKINWVAEQQIIGKIGKFRAPHLRYPALICLTHFLFSTPSDTFHETFFKHVLKVEKQYPEAEAATVFLAHLNHQGIKTEPLVDILNTSSIRKDLKHFEKLQILTSFLDILNREKIHPNQKSILLSLLNKDELFLGLQQITTIMQLGETDELTLNCDLKTKFNSILNKHLYKLEIENVSEKWLRTFGASRASSSVFTYFGQIAELDDDDAMDSITDYISWVLEGTFQTNRYKKYLDRLPQEQLKIWKTELTADLNPVEKTCPLFQPKDWMRQKLWQDGHLPDFTKHYPKLAEKLGVPAEESKESNLPSKRPDQKTREEFEKIALQLIGTQSTETQLELLSQMNKLKLPLGEFKNDLQGQIQSMQPKAQSVGKVKAIETDDPYHLLLCGTEVSGSCQRIGGDPRYNRGLLGYLLHGQTRLIAIVSEENQILSRALLRVLLDKKTKTPVLFLERIYGNEGYKQDIMEMAKLKGRKMGIPVTTLQGNGPSYGDSLISFGGSAPYEYCDATRSIKDKGEFEIQNLRLLI